MTQKEFDLFSKAMLFLVNAYYENCGAVPINPRVTLIDPETGEEVTPRA